MTVKYPDIEVQLTGENGNAYSILGAMKRGLQKGGVDSDEIDEFMNDAMAGDYDHLLATTQEWVTVL